MKPYVRFLAILAASLAICIGIGTVTKLHAAQSQDQSLLIESWIERLTFAKAGNGDKTVYIFCGPECPRCAKLSGLIDALPPEQATEFEFRWVMQRGMEDDLLYIMEGGNVGEMYAKQQGRPIIDLDGLIIGMAYNDIILSQILRFIGPWPAYTPVIVTKENGMFRVRNLENIENDFPANIAGASKIVSKPVVPVIKEVFLSFQQVEKPVFMLTKNDTPFRLLPEDESPAIDVTGPGHAVKPVIEKDGWYGIEFDSPPFLFIKKEEVEIIK